MIGEKNGRKAVDKSGREIMEKIKDSPIITNPQSSQSKACYLQKSHWRIGNKKNHSNYLHLRNNMKSLVNPAVSHLSAMERTLNSELAAIEQMEESSPMMPASSEEFSSTCELTTPEVREGSQFFYISDVEMVEWELQRHVLTFVQKVLALIQVLFAFIWQLS